MTNEIIYVSVNWDEIPPYMFWTPNGETLSGFKLQKPHEYTGFGTFGAIWHGTTLIKNDATRKVIDARTGVKSLVFHLMFV